MTENTIKRRPGIPHDALAYIAEKSGCTVSHVPVGREMHVQLKVGDSVFTAANNTALLIDVFKSLGVNGNV